LRETGSAGIPVHMYQHTFVQKPLEEFVCVHATNSSLIGR
jgi:hypothetical protein